MRHKGRLDEWNDARGFGFVTPIGGGDRVFLHIKALSNRQRRPVAGELVVYEVAKGPKGLQAVNATLSGQTAEPKSSASPSGPGGLSLAFAALFLLFVAALVVAGRLPARILGGYALLSAITFFVYAWDKSAAQNEERRTAESTLQLLGLLGGWPGGLLAQKWLRHKSRKQPFRTVFWCTVLLNCGALAWFLIAPIFR
jgi:uncharacterized membrane protein YsdA (DUF1294 family)/cold shock CspA family protein